MRTLITFDGRVAALSLAAGLVLGSPHAHAQAPAEDAPAIVPAEETAAAYRDPSWQVPRFSWGDPNLEGTYTSRDMSGIPMERPERYGIRQHLTPAELEERLNEPDRVAALAGDQSDENRLELSALDSAETGTRTFGYTSYIIDPRNGQMPALTEEGQARQEANRRSMNGPFYTTEGFSYYDRCISRGVTGSIGPSLYGDAMRIIQTPTEVAISYEMLHDTRIIPLDGTPPADPAVRQYMGSSIGYWDGDTLVVETTNFTDELRVGRMAHSEDLKLTERFTRVDPDMIDYVVTVEDPRTFERPWTYRLTLTTQPGYEILEYSCHEGNFFVANALRAEKLYQESVREAIANGDPIPQRSEGSEGRSIFAPPSPEEAVNINAAGAARAVPPQDDAAEPAPEAAEPAPDAAEEVEALRQSLGALPRALALTGAGSGYEPAPGNGARRHYRIERWSLEWDLERGTIAEQVVRAGEDASSEPRTAAAEAPWRERYIYWMLPHTFLDGASAHGARLETRAAGPDEQRVVTFTPPGGAPVRGFLDGEGRLERIRTEVGEASGARSMRELVFFGGDASGPFAPEILIEKHDGELARVLVIRETDIDGGAAG